MARPRKSVALDRFTSTELALAADITVRAFHILTENRLAPDAVDEDAGKGGWRFWDSYGLAEAALTGAVHKAGAELLMAARIAKLVLDDFVGPRGYLPSRLSDYVRTSLNPTPGGFPWGSDPVLDLRINDDFWLHHLLRARSTIYRPRSFMEGDMILEIADRRFAFYHFDFSDPKRHLPVLMPWGTRLAGTPEMIFAIESWERGKDAAVRAYHELIDFSAIEDDHEKKAAAAALEEELLAARRNAVGMLSVNVSLAIRNAFDRVHDHRLETGALESRADLTAGKNGDATG